MLLLALAAAAALPQLPVERYTLDNGLTVILSEDHRSPVVAIDVWYRVGAADERPGRSGLAHLFEHLMFQGTSHLAGDERAVFGLLERAGASFANASTDFDRTNYLETLPADQLAIGLWLESERMGFLLDALDQHKLDTQREVVRNERREQENAPYGRGELRLVELLFPAPHPYHGSVIGAHADLVAATLDEAKAFFRAGYSPSNAILVLCGDLAPAAAKALVAEDFAGLPRGPEKPKVVAKTVPVAELRRQGARLRDELTDHVQLAKVMIGAIGPAPGAADELAVSVLAFALAKGKASRLYRALVHDRELAQDVDASYTALQLGGPIEIDATVAAGKSTEELEAALGAELRRLREEPLSAPELARAKIGREAELVRQLENPGGFNGRADVLAALQLWEGDPARLPARVERLRAISAEEVRAAAARYLRDEDRAVVVVRPEGGR